MSTSESLFDGPPVPNPFDSTETYIRKWAVYLNVTEDWLYPEWEVGTDVPVPATIADRRYVSVYDIINSAPELALSEIFLSLPEVGPVINDYQARVFTYQYNRTRPNVLTVELINQFFADLALSERLENIETFRTTYTEWLSHYEQDLAKQYREIRQLLEYQGLMAKQVPVVYSPFVFTKISIRGRARINTSTGPADFNPSNILLFIDACQASPHVPFIRFEGDTGDVVYKIYREPEYLNRIRMEFITPKVGSEKRPNIVDFKVWADLERYTQKSFVSGTLNLEDGEFLIVGIAVDRIQPEQIYQKLLQSFPIVISDTSFEGISGRLELYGRQSGTALTGLELNIPVLFDLISNHPLFYNYLHLEESIDPSGEKEKFSIMFSANVEEASRRDSANIHNPSVAAASFLSETTVAREIILNDQTRIMAPNGLKYVTMRISKGKNLDEVARSIRIFTTLLPVYLDYVNPVSHYYRLFLPPTTGLIIKKKSPLKTGTSRANLLKEHFTGIILEGWARQCQGKFQPIIITDLEAWRAQTFEKNGMIYHRDALPYPADKPMGYLGCDSDEVPFINIKVNKDPGFPYIPCCQTKPIQQNKLYKLYYQNMAVPQKTTGTIISTDKELGPRRQGEADPLLAKLFTVAGYDVGLSRLRFGVLESRYSAIHCLCQALVPEYQNAGDAIRQEIAHQYRQRLKAMEPAVFKQELFDSTTSEIRSRLEDDTLFLDTKFYYRGLEELFGVNIYVFFRDNQTPDRSLALQIPRHDRFHCRFNMDRPTVVLYQRPTTQYELIMLGKRESNKLVRGEYVFGEPLRNMLYNLLNTVHRTYSIQITPPFQALENPVKNPLGTDLKQRLLYNRTNPFSQFLIDEILPEEAEILGQYIDNMGKARGCQFRFTLDGKVYTASMFLPPGQPLKYPQIAYTPTNLPLSVIDRLGTPYSADQVDGMVVGVWFSALDIAEAIYVPVVPTRARFRIPVGSHNPWMGYANNLVKRYTKLRALYDAMEQLLVWVYKIANRQHRQTATEDLTSAAFFDQYVRVRTDRPDSLKTYQLVSAIQISDVLPITADLATAFAYIKQKVLGLIVDSDTGSYFNLYSEKMAAGFRYTLSQLIKNTASLMIKEERALDIIPLRINTQLTEADFAARRYNSILIGEQSYRQWLVTQSGSTLSNFKPNLDVKLLLEEKPYLYMTPNGRGYLVQNVRLADKYRALSLALNWHVSRFNTGYDTPAYRDKDGAILSFPHVVYGIGPNNNLNPIEDHTGGLEDYLEIVFFGHNKYTALLPIV